MGIWLYILGIFFVFVVATIIFHISRRDSRWASEHAVFATAEFHGRQVTIKNIVQADYHAEYQCSVRHYDKTFHEDNVQSVWIFVQYFPVRFGPFRFNIAHIFLSFQFSDGSFISVSAAGRRKQEEKVTLSRIFPYRNRLIYKIIRERDTVHARAFFGSNKVFLYKVRANQKVAQTILRSMLTKANALAKKPQWFNSFSKNCITEAVQHIRNGGIHLPKWHCRYVVTSKIDKFLYERGAIKEKGLFDVIREKHDITQKVRKNGKKENLSNIIRCFE